jgi:hypothetical protein
MHTPNMGKKKLTQEQGMLVLLKQIEREMAAEAKHRRGHECIACRMYAYGVKSRRQLPHSCGK